MAGHDCSHHVDPRSPEDGFVGGLYVNDKEFCDDVEWIRADWELDRARVMGFAPIETIK